MKLADVNLLVAIAHTIHPHHAAALAWQKQHRITTCPITELGLVRVLMQLGLPADDAMTQLETMKKHADFVPCDVPGSAIAGKVTGHKQTTDAYLLGRTVWHGNKWRRRRSFSRLAAQCAMVFFDPPLSAIHTNPRRAPRTAAWRWPRETPAS